MKTPEHVDKTYISYFQSVTTLGIMNSARNEKEAAAKAKDRMENGSCLSYCAFEQTPFKHTLTEPSGITYPFNANSIDVQFKISKIMRNVIATRMQKTPDDLTDEDIIGFIEDTLEKSLKTPKK